MSEEFPRENTFDVKINRIERIRFRFFFFFFCSLWILLKKKILNSVRFFIRKER